MGLVINPCIKMRRDGNRAILFSVNASNSIYGPCFRFLNPIQAILLSLFDGKRDLAAVKEAVAYIFDLDAQTASDKVDAMLSLPVSREYTIGTFIVDASDIDTRSIRFYDPRVFAPDKDLGRSDGFRCKIPYRMFVLPTMRCYTRCRYCYADRYGFRGKEFDISLFKDLLKQAKYCGMETVDFSGGDIFCRSDAFELIECTLSMGMYPNIPTKYPLSRDQIEHLAETGLSIIQISIDALDPDIIDNLVAVSPGYGNKILKTLNHLREAGIKVRTNSVLTPYNIEDAINLAKYLAEQPHIFKSHFTCYGRSLYCHDDRLFCSPEDISKFENDFNKIKKEFPGKFFFSGLIGDPYKGDESERASVFSKRAICTANRGGFVVLPDGRVTICEELYFHEGFIIGDLYKQNIIEIWNSPKALELAHPSQSSVPDGSCKDCSDFSNCHEGLGRCFRDCLKAYGVNRPHWPDPRCPRAPMGNRMV
jgi:radical SAM protein with 4Fe4S-binding SPASM domain